MASIFSHPAIPVALYYAKRGSRFSKPLLYLCIFLTLLPDADVIAFKFGIPYESQWGHRGFTHSIVFAVAMGFISQFFYKKLDSSRLMVFIMTFLSTLSHCVLDALTNGGLGVAFFWPFTDERYFFPLQPIQVSPIGVRGFLSFRGVVVLLSEIIWIWFPCLLLSRLVRYFRSRQE